MSALVDQHPAVSAVDAQLAEVAEAERRFMDWLREQTAAHQAALEAHRAALQEAMDTGAPPPAWKPEPLVSDEDRVSRLAAVQGRRRELGEQRTQAVAEAGPEVLAEAKALVADAVDRAREHVEALGPILAVIRDARAAAYETAVAQSVIDRADPHKGGQQLQPPQTMDVADLVAAVVRGGSDLLDVTAMPRRLGLSGAGWHLMPDRAWEPPLPPGPHRRPA